MVKIEDAEISLSFARIGLDYDRLMNEQPENLEKIRSEVAEMVKRESPEYFDSPEGKNAVDVEVKRYIDL
jgi:hypothetical protein